MFILLYLVLFGIRKGKIYSKQTTIKCTAVVYSKQTTIKCTAVVVKGT